LVAAYPEWLPTRKKCRGALLSSASKGTKEEILNGLKGRLVVFGKEYRGTGGAAG